MVVVPWFGFRWVLKGSLVELCLGVELVTRPGGFRRRTVSEPRSVGQEYPLDIQGGTRSGRHHRSGRIRGSGMLFGPAYGLRRATSSPPPGATLSACRGLVGSPPTEHHRYSLEICPLSSQPVALIGGGTRFIATHACKALVAAGISTCAVYGQPESVPITEDTALVPVNPYGRTKLAVEHALADYVAAYGLRSVRLRYFNACGCDPDGENGESRGPETHLVPRAILAALGRLDESSPSSATTTRLRTVPPCVTTSTSPTSRMRTWPPSVTCSAASADSRFGRSWMR